MLSEMERMHVHAGGNNGLFGDGLDNKGMLLSQRGRHNDDRERELLMFRSGSAPPSVEGSLNAIRGLFGQGDPLRNEVFSEEEEKLRSDPDYLSYYYSNVNLNPRLPPPSLTKEDSRLALRLKAASSSNGGIGDHSRLGSSENGGDRSMFMNPPGFSSRKEIDIESNSKALRGSSEWGSNGLIGLPGLGMGSNQKSIAEMLQDDFGNSSRVPENPSRPASRNTLDEGYIAQSPTEAEDELVQLRRSSVVHNSGPPTAFSHAALLGSSLSRNASPDPQLLARASSPSITPIGFGRTEKRVNKSPISFHEVSSTANETTVLDKFSSLSLSSVDNVAEEKHLEHHISGNSSLNLHSYLPDMSNGLEINTSDTGNKDRSQVHNFSFVTDRHSDVIYSNSYKESSVSTFNIGVSSYQNVENPALASLMAGQRGTSNLPPLFDHFVTAATMGVPEAKLRELGIAPGAAQLPFVDPMYLQYLKTAEYPAAAQIAALSGQFMDQKYGNNPYMDMLRLQNPYLCGVLSSPISQRSNKYRNHSHGGYYGNHANGLSFPGSPLCSRNELKMRFHSGMNNIAPSLLDEFKSNKTVQFELSDIAGHVVEFSADQYGSRFIQQKLETATNEEKSIVYQEVFPEALMLMTDVFGNYVVQKLFEHGLPDQRRGLGNKLYGNVLMLSLQMYGCRVIQKAIEVVDLEQKIKMVQELDNHVMRCVHDQNGNHVIQKCIECVPEEYIQFIITTLYDQVVTLSTHSYGCRVIQRVLEHCHNEGTQKKVMEEILGSISMLAQDQYGNYVIQHVLEHGKPYERSLIIQELSGSFVQMSQQKFASNVVEKCLAFGNPSERQFLINQMLGSTDENEPLQAMMKDQFANYVVQKVLETCDDQQRELIMTRIKIHLNALKKYTYGKHIVARVEKLITAGERRMASSSL